MPLQFGWRCLAQCDAKRNVPSGQYAARRPSPKQKRMRPLIGQIIQMHAIMHKVCIRPKCVYKIVIMLPISAV